MTHTAVLFDLDGTLLDSLEDIADSMNVVLTDMGFPAHPVEAYKKFVGDGVPPLVERALPAGGRNPELIERIGHLLSEEYRKSWHKKTRPYPGIPQLLTGLSTAGIPMSIFSNKPDEFTRTMVKTLLPDWSFVRVTGIKPGVPRKPDPSAALETARIMNVPPENFAYLGDTNTDMLTARAAGMFAVGALWGFRSREELEESGAHMIIAEPYEFLQLF